MEEGEEDLLLGWKLKQMERADGSTRLSGPKWQATRQASELS